MKSFITNKKHLCTAALGAMALALLPSCQDEEFGYTADQIKYAKNFTDKYGQIPADKSWDLSSWAQAQTVPTSSSVQTRAGGTGQLISGTDYEVSSEEYVVPANLMSWMKENLVEGRDNRSLGSSFMLRLPQNDFAIIPIFQGNSAFMSELEMKVNTRNLTKIWTKSENMWAQETEGGAWEKLYYFDGWETYDRWYPSKSVHGASTLNSYSVKTTPIIFHPAQMTSGSDNDRLMYLSLHNIDKYYQDEDIKWDANDKWGTIGDRLTSINSNGYMLAMPIPFDISPLPSIGSYSGECHTMLIGVEDAKGADSDHDTNDIVFLVVGYPNVPEIISTTETIKKRYMCEDLGATDDFDFNDIVIDVTQTSSKKLKTTPANQADNVRTDGEFELSYEFMDFSQTARLAHVCGTLPFQVVVGNTVFPKVVDPTILSNTRDQLAAATTTRSQNEVLENGWNPNEVKKVEGWNPATNNIKIFVDWSGSRKPGVANPSDWTDERPNPNINDPSPEDLLIAEFDNGKFKVVTFPDKGTVPYIIATDQDVPWMAERVDIPDSWVGRNGTTASTNDHTGAASDQGNRLNMDENEEEVTIWNGPFTATEQYSQGVQMNRLSEFHAAIVEALEAGYNVVNVYTQGATEIGLCCNTSEKGWNLLTSGDPEGYRSSDGKHSICLTADQIRTIKQLGLIVQAREENGMTFDKITMTKSSTKELSLEQTRFGRIRVSPIDYVKWSGSTVPFEKAAFPTGTKLKLTAVPADNTCTFIKWSDGNTDDTREITLNENMSLSALFNSESAAQFYVMSNDPGTNPIPVKFWNEDEKQDLNFESMKIEDPSHVTLVLDCDRWSETPFQFMTNSKNNETVQHKIISSEVEDIAEVITGSYPEIKIKTNAGRTGKMVFEIWQNASNGFVETQHIIVTVYIKKKSFVLSEEPASIGLSYLNPNKVIGYSWIRQSKLNLSLKNSSDNVGVWTDGSNNIHIDAKKNGDDRLVINYTGSDHYLGVYKEIPVSVADYSWDACDMHLLRVNGAQDGDNANKYTITDGDMRLATQNWGYDKNIKVVIKLSGSGLISVNVSNQDGSKSHAVQPVPADGFSKFNSDYNDANGIPARSIVFILSADDYKNYFSGKNMIVNFDLYDSSDLVPSFYVTETKENSYASF